MAKRFQFRHVNELTGLFVLMVLVGAVVALVLAARSQHWFAATTEYRLQLPASGASGLKPGDEVVVLGLPAGIVNNVVVDAGGQLDARITLREDFAQFIRTDSRATIKRVFGVAGDSFVELSRGTRGEPLKRGATLPCDSSDELPALVDRVYEEFRAEALPLVKKVSDLVDEWSKLGANLNTSQGELQQAMARFNRIAANLEAGEGTAGRLLTDTNFIVQAERVLGQSQETLTQLQVVLGQLKEGTAALPEVTENLRRGTANLPAISAAVEAETRDLPGLVLQMQQTAAELQRLTEAIQRHWLLRSHVEPRQSGGRIPPEAITGGAP
jgi:phospholipid/cholesterol/gamma-HCH transport system substrate-binding protein